MDNIASAERTQDQTDRAPSSTDLPEAPGRWIDTSRGRLRARLSARGRHPVAWLFSALTRRRGVGGPDQTPLGANEVLERVSALPLSVWTYGFDHDSVRHMGPMAQDFATAFGLGYTNRGIHPVDANGVCLASIQALHRRLAALEAEVTELRNGTR
ncbi:tail fiber domain-containing protein [Rhodococcus daqingensis]|uniref:Tail fiber domain-containing protein n=1 Tax=Rhodococcus daqingensis TaxID=2479363 RepID=A0ABW2RZ73_9NOCA